jgi:SpoVK/Ycf46/Vps4 family AAA+-type ATPase
MKAGLASLPQPRRTSRRTSSDRAATEGSSCSNGLAPLILFLDELDIIAPALDGIQSWESEVFLLAATNHIGQIDPAVLSRFQERVSIPLPDFEARERLLTFLLQKKRLAFDVADGARALAAMSEGKGMSGRDLESWVSRAERKALPRAIAAGGPQHFALLVDYFDSPLTETTVAG